MCSLSWTNSFTSLMQCSLWKVCLITLAYFDECFFSGFVPAAGCTLTKVGSGVVTSCCICGHDLSDGSFLCCIVLQMTLSDLLSVLVKEKSECNCEMYLYCPMRCLWLVFCGPHWSLLSFCLYLIPHQGEAVLLLSA